MHLTLAAPQAVEMCAVLVEKLSCSAYTELGALDGLAHFCSHVRVEQEREVRYPHLHA